MTTILISIASSIVSSSIISSLLTILLAPRVQHGFWSRQRITELRLATYDKVNGITAAIYTMTPAEWNFKPMEDPLALLMAAGDEVKNRFSDAALSAYKKLEVMVEASGLPTDKRAGYSVARDMVLQLLHAESLA